MNKDIFKKCFDELEFTPIIEYINSKWDTGIKSILDEGEGVFIVDFESGFYKYLIDDLKRLLIKLIIQEVVKKGDKIETSSINDGSYIYRKDTGLRFKSFPGAVKGIVTGVIFGGLNFVIQVFDGNQVRQITDLVSKSEFKFQRRQLDGKDFIESLSKDDDIQSIVDNVFNRVKKLSFVEKVKLGDKLEIYINPEMCRGDTLNGFQYGFTIPPLVILLDYRNGIYSIGNLNGTHPHVNSGRICLGDFQETINSSRKDVEYCVIMLYELLTTYNGGSPHYSPNSFSLSNCYQQTKEYNEIVGTNHVYERIYYKGENIISYEEIRSEDEEDLLNF